MRDLVQQTAAIASVKETMSKEGDAEHTLRQCLLCLRPPANMCAVGVDASSLDFANERNKTNVQRITNTRIKGVTAR